MMPLFKNEEDEEYVRILFRKAVMNQKMTSGLIDKKYHELGGRTNRTDGHTCNATGNNRGS
ncbi:MAG TPA: hypothetical protein VHO68_06565, partial [Bacteroidales bacterium]|nr:hypothetical protein [Bacteroidales bacterium]